MAKKPITEDDFANMSDEDFLALDEADYSGNVPEGETSLTNEEPVHVEQEPVEEPVDESQTGDSTDTPSGDGQSDESNDGSDSGSSDEGEETPTGETDPLAGEGEPASEESASENGEQSTSDAQEEGETGSETSEGGVGDVSGDGEVKAEDKKPADTPAKAGYYKLPEGMDTAQMDTAVGFYQKITAPFKADGKDITVRSAEDAIRLMQQGVNYSRRMQEIKPMKALNRMLTDQGLNDPQKLNFLIDLSKGDKAAITQLLKSHKIDPMDLDTEKDSGYQARNYQGDPQDNEFRDALDMALTTPEGQALVSHIHKDWDRLSKAKLRENPSIIGNLSEMKASGVYDKVVEELDYQRSLGYMQGIPFLQAFDQVGEAMKNAGVFNTQPNPAQQGNPMAPLASQPQGQPVASGARKQNQAPKKPAANPHLSSTPPSKQSGNQAPAEPDFDKMSDEEFLKMAPPE